MLVLLVLYIIVMVACLSVPNFRRYGEIMLTPFRALWNLIRNFLHF